MDCPDLKDVLRLKCEGSVAYWPDQPDPVSDLKIIHPPMRRFKLTEQEKAEWHEFIKGHRCRHAVSCFRPCIGSVLPRMRNWEMDLPRCDECCADPRRWPRQCDECMWK